MLPWIHEISQSALAAAVLTLGCVILLELRSIAHLRRAVDGNLNRVFEQLDLLRFESQQLVEAQTQTIVQVPAAAERCATASRALPEPTQTVYVSAAPVQVAAPTPSPRPAPEPVAVRADLGAGEARLLASLQAARVRRQGETARTDMRGSTLSQLA